MTPIIPVQYILDEIAVRYDQDYSERVWALTQAYMTEYGPDDPMPSSFAQVISINRVMMDEGFSPSERGKIEMSALEAYSGVDMPQEAWNEMEDIPVYEPWRFSSGVRAEIERRLGGSSSFFSDGSNGQMT